MLGISTNGNYGLSEIQPFSCGLRVATQSYVEDNKVQTLLRAFKVMIGFK